MTEEEEVIAEPVEEGEANDNYSSMTAGISFATAPLLDKPIETEIEAQAFREVVDAFFNSQDVFDELKAFIAEHYPKVVEILQTPESPLILP